MRDGRATMRPAWAGEAASGPRQRITMGVQGKRALITGASRGVGAVTALKLAELGVHVAVNYARSRQEGEAVAAKARALGVTGIAIGADISRGSEAARLVDEAARALGGLDILVNNAAITRFIDLTDLAGVTDEAWDDIFGTNVRGLFNVTRAAAPHLKASGDGVVVNLGSLAGLSDAGSSIPYCASKAAVHSLTRTLSRALAPEVRVNCVAPGFINTEWHLRNPKQGAYQTRLDQAKAETLLKKVCEPEDIADAILSFIVYNRFATGQVLMVAGGRRV